MVAKLRSGQVVVMAYDPEDRRLHWVRGGWGFNADPHLTLVDCTVDRCEAQEGTATPGEVTERDGTTIWRLGRSEDYQLSLLHDGKQWNITARGDLWVTVLGEHWQTCGHCGELWPCREQRLDDQARRLVQKLDDLCAHCGQPIGAAWSDSFNDGLTRRRYHTAKKYRAHGKTCRAAFAEAKAAVPGGGSS